MVEVNTRTHEGRQFKPHDRQNIQKERRGVHWTKTMLHWYMCMSSCKHKLTNPHIDLVVMSPQAKKWPSTEMCHSNTQQIILPVAVIYSSNIALHLRPKVSIKLHTNTIYNSRWLYLHHKVRSFWIYLSNVSSYNSTYSIQTTLFIPKGQFRF